MSETHHVTIDPDALARQIDQIAAASLDGDSAERLASIAQMLLTELRAREAWLMSVYTLIGRCDMAFELITTAVSLAIAKKAARQLRSEIKKASGG